MSYTLFVFKQKLSNAIERLGHGLSQNEGLKLVMINMLYFTFLFI